MFIWGGPGSSNLAACAPGLIADDVIAGPHATVWAGGVDFHQVLAELVEKIGSTPTVNEFAVAIESLAIGGAKLGVLGVSAHDGFHDLGVGAHRVLAGEIVVGTQHECDFIEIRGDFRFGIFRVPGLRGAGFVG